MVVARRGKDGASCIAPRHPKLLGFELINKANGHAQPFFSCQNIKIEAQIFLEIVNFKPKKHSSIANCFIHVDVYIHSFENNSFNYNDFI